MSPRPNAFLGTKVARRQLLLFVLCALLPITALALVSFSHVTRQLTQQSHARLRESSKASGMAIFQRLQLLDAELRLVTTESKSGLAAPETARRLPGNSTGFSALVVQPGPGMADGGPGRSGAMPLLTDEQIGHLRTGKSVIVPVTRVKAEPRILMARLVDPSNDHRGVLWGEVAPGYLWGLIGGSESLPDTEVCVVVVDATPLMCTLPGEGLPAELAAHAAAPGLNAFEWSTNRQAFITGAWTLFLKPVFLADAWTVMLSEPRTVVLSPLGEFKTSFALILLLSLWVVLLISNMQIRRSLEPLERLQEATLRLAQREFHTPVVITSGDEFENLASSFNAMSQRLARQFQALETSNHIDRAILTALDRGQIVETMVQRAPEIVPCDAVAVMVVGPESNHAQTWGATRLQPERTQHSRLNLSALEAAALARAGSGLHLAGEAGFPEYLAPTSASFSSITHWIAFPILLRGELAGALAFGYVELVLLTDDDRTQARHLADQVAVGLSNADLIQELDSLNIGALTALARVIDAKSPWTAGHSERVTAAALGIARQLGLDQAGLETLRRGALMHDIGKIGIPLDILDKPGRLTPEETTVMQQHVRIGARILEPIPGYSEVIPAVLHHHERFDGLGYPDGLAGQAIHLHARILAVADNYDALSSDRPYRPGLDLAVCTEIIRRGAGREFDPAVVAAFFAFFAAGIDQNLAAGMPRPARDAA